MKRVLLLIPLLFWVVSCGDNNVPAEIDDGSVEDPTYPYYTPSGPDDVELLPEEPDTGAPEPRGCEHGRGEGIGRCHGKGNPHQ